jgi:hypothetical protein
LVAFGDSEQARATQAAIEAAATRLRIRPEFKFNKCRDEIRDAFFETVSPFDFCVRAIAVKKQLIYSSRLRSEKEAFYSFFVKSMLNFDDGLLEAARIVIDGSGDRGFRRELEAYQRRHLGRGKVKSIRFRNSQSDPLVQLADMPVLSPGRSRPTGVIVGAGATCWARRSKMYGSFDEVRPACPSRRSLPHAHPPVTVRADGATLPPIDEIRRLQSQMPYVDF